LEISGKRYPGTPDLWNLLTAKGRPVLGLATEKDKRNYEEIMVNSGAIRSSKDPERPVGNNWGYKWQNIIKPIWVKYEKKTKEEAKLEAKQNAKKSETSTEKNKKQRRLSPKRSKRFV